MRAKKMLQLVLIFSLILPSISAASDWIKFGTSQKNGLNWYYDKDGVIYFQDRKFMGIQIPVKKKKFQRIWIKSSADSTERVYQVDLNCRDHTARLKDDAGKSLYSENSMDYLYDKPIPPDTVLDMLQKTVCK